METNTTADTTGLDYEDEGIENYAVNTVNMHVAKESQQLWAKWRDGNSKLPKDLPSFTATKAMVLQRLLDEDKYFFPIMVDVEEGRYVCYSLLGVTKGQDTKVVVATVFEGSKGDAIQHHMQAGVHMIVEFVKVHEFSGVFG